MNRWPGRWIEHHQQRKEVCKRIESAGGWTVLVNDCKQFLATNEEAYFHYFPRSQTNVVFPASIVALKPQIVGGDKTGDTKTVQLQIFGFGHRRGAADCFLWIVTDDPNSNVLAQIQRQYPSCRHIHQLANSVFEIY